MTSPDTARELELNGRIALVLSLNDSCSVLRSGVLCLYATQHFFCMELFCSNVFCFCLLLLSDMYPCFGRHVFFACFFSSILLGTAPFG